MGLRLLTCSALKINYATATSIKKAYLMRLWYEHVTINQITVPKRSWTTHIQYRLPARRSVWPTKKTKSPALISSARQLISERALSYAIILWRKFERKFTVFTWRKCELIYTIEVLQKRSVMSSRHIMHETAQIAFGGFLRHCTQISTQCNKVSFKNSWRKCKKL